MYGDLHDMEVALACKSEAIALIKARMVENSLLLRQAFQKAAQQNCAAGSGLS
jgi:hypothetical protein